MPILWENVGWMGFNIVLALIAWVLAYLGFVRKYPTRVRVVLWVLWLLFIPNTVYVLTDIMHFSGQFILMRVDQWFWLILEYSLLYAIGIVSYFGSLYLFEKYLGQQKWARRNHSLRIVIVCGLNLLIIIGVMMGRIQRTNSWDVFTQPVRVASDFMRVLTSLEIVFTGLIFWLLTTMLYFLLKKLAVKS